MWFVRNRAMNHASDIIVPKNCERHHWSYNPEHWANVIIIEKMAHKRVHTFMKLNKDSLMYVIKKTGELLDTREKHFNFISKIVTLPSQSKIIRHHRTKEIIWAEPFTQIHLSI